ncbi:methyltransferase type 11 [candidate division BRC1 bacterium HGW-BRC1-1]|jgi:ubiquinone/menaquinone biosynthesis C-methylase UbiE|nr:MAG: methyltransferase type 11 [candidate division BRC1 bacterium HGW-BRC1-1]
MNFIAFAIVMMIVVFLTWRFASRRQSLPCPVWLRWMVELDNPFTKTNRAEVIVGLLDLQPGMMVLDVGCGPGRLAVPLGKAVAPTGEVVAMDIQPGMLARARAKAQAAGVDNIRFMEAGAGEGKAGYGQFDRVLMVTVLGEIPDREGALAEVYNALKPGGLLSVTEVIFDPHFQRRSTLTAMAEHSGLRSKAFYGHALAYTQHFEKPAVSCVSDNPEGPQE